MGDNSLPGDGWEITVSQVTGQNVMEWIRRKSFFEVVIEEESVGVCGGLDR